MNEEKPRKLALIAGKDAYPLLLAESARAEGLEHLFVIAFKKETDPAIDKFADDIEWITLGQLQAMMDALERSGCRHAVMAGQITPTHLFRVRPDKRLLNLLNRLRKKNAETIFGAVADELSQINIELLPASMFMESHMPEPGLLSSRAPTESEQNDIKLGLNVAKVTSGLDIGQTVVIKEGTILAIEAFEGTNETIARAAKLGGPGTVIVKVAKKGHDMRFDIPVVGLKTMKLLKKSKTAVLAIEAGRSILLEREKIIAEADRLGICLTAVAQDENNE